MKNMLIAASALGIAIAAMVMLWRRTAEAEEVAQWKADAEELDGSEGGWPFEVERNTQLVWSKN